MRCAFLAALVILASVGAYAQADDAVEQKFDDVVNAIIDRDFERGAALSREILESHRESAEISMRAYNHLLWVLFEQAGTIVELEEQQKIRDVIREAAREALLRFPRITAGEDIGNSFAINDRYIAEREKLFGQLRISCEPDSAMVYIDEKPYGTFPFYEDYYRAGTYTLRVTAEGYNEHVEEFAVEANRPNSIAIVLSPHRGRWWWLSRVGAPIAAATGVVVAVILGGDEPATEEPPPPLPGPPDPPTQ